jgi:hypothetical protein
VFSSNSDYSVLLAHTAAPVAATATVTSSDAGNVDATRLASVCNGPGGAAAHGAATLSNATVNPTVASTAGSNCTQSLDGAPGSFSGGRDHAKPVEGATATIQAAAVNKNDKKVGLVQTTLDRQLPRHAQRGASNTLALSGLEYTCVGYKRTIQKDEKCGATARELCLAAGTASQVASTTDTSRGQRSCTKRPDASTVRHCSVKRHRALLSCV